MDWAFVNGIIHGPGRRRASAVATSGGRIVYTGSDEGAKALAGLRTEVIDLRGKMIVPAFCDAHIHPLLGGINLTGLDLISFKTLNEYQIRLREYSCENPARSFIRGSGWMHGCFPHSGPNKSDLDKIISDRPVFLKAIDGHSAWVNSKALEMAGITKNTSDPVGGRIERDDQTGEPTGALRELAAMALVGDRLPPPSREEMLAGARFFLSQAARYGITAIHDPMATREFMDVYLELEQRGELTVRVSAALVCDPASPENTIPELLELSRACRGRQLRVETAKIFLDGVVDSHTAFLLDSYIDRPGFRGEPLWEAEEFKRTAAALDQEGIQIHIHAIGDAAVRMALDGLEYIIGSNGRRDARHQIAHLDLTSQMDIPRFQALGVIAVIQPAWFYMDSNFFDSALPFLGKARAMQLYRMRSLMESGAAVASSSDWPFGGDRITFNPLDTIKIGRTRRGIGGDFQEAYNPEEGVSVESLIDSHTIVGAYANFLDGETGSIEPGKIADLVVLDRDLLGVPAEEIHQTRVLLTLLGGYPVFRDECF